MKYATLAVVAMIAALAAALTPPASQKDPAVPGAEARVAPASVTPERAARDIDLAICLDTSNSMDGLIGSAKQKLWAIVNELALARPRPKLRVAIYQYGNSNLTRETGWVQQVSGLTDDLDTIYGKLFALKTRGGTEYVARVVSAATQDLQWSGQNNALKIIVVAGNEAATQDKKLKLEETCHATVSKGIVINTIFCGPEGEGRRTGWSDAARWADGRYAAIDQNHGTVAITTPHDKKLVKLGGKLNETYIAYGSRGQAGAANQSAQDANAVTAGAPAGAQRAAAKATGLYTNAAWDLVDAAAQEKLDVKKVREEDLPPEMKKMTPEEREAHVKQMAQRRAKIQKDIRDLSADRDAYVKKEMKRKGLDEKGAFDAALRRAVREQAEKKGMKFEKPVTTQEK